MDLIQPNSWPKRHCYHQQNWLHCRCIHHLNLPKEDSSRHYPKRHHTFHRECTFIRRKHSILYHKNMVIILERGLFKGTYGISNHGDTYWALNPLGWPNVFLLGLTVDFQRKVIPIDHSISNCGMSTHQVVAIIVNKHIKGLSIQGKKCLNNFCFLHLLLFNR